MNQTARTTRNIVRLVGQVVTVSVETVQLVKELAGLSIDQI
jgi:hypothetical protein